MFTKSFQPNIGFFIVIYISSHFHSNILVSKTKFIFIQYNVAYNLMRFLLGLITVPANSKANNIKQLTLFRNQNHASNGGVACL